MAIFNRYPYTSFQELNLDWILQQIKDLTDEWAVFENQYQGITADATTVPYGMGASVTVTGGDGIPFNFDFNIPAGKDLKLASSIVKYGVSDDTVTPPGTWYDSMPAVPQGKYLWTRVTLNFNDGTQSTFYTASRNGLDGLGSVVTVNNISPDGNGNVSLPMPQPSNNTPLMDTALGSEGVSNDYSRADHQHQSDTSKLDVQNGTQAGDLNAYVVQDISTQTKMAISSSADANAIARYTANGTLVVAEPQTVYEAPRLLDVQNGFVSNTTISNYVAKTDIATASTLGIVQPDGVTITVDSDGIITASAGSITYTTLWSNADTTQNFTGQTITSIGIEDYNSFLFIYRNTKSSSGDAFMSVYVTVKGQNYLTIGSGGAYLRTREFRVSDSEGLVIGGALQYSTYGNTTQTNDNSCNIPVALIGIS